MRKGREAVALCMWLTAPVCACVCVRVASSLPIGVCIAEGDSLPGYV